MTYVYDRPFWPPGAEIAAQAYDALAAWEERWTDDLEDVPATLDRIRIYKYMADGIDIDLAKAMARVDGELGKQED